MGMKKNIALLSLLILATVFDVVKPSKEIVQITDENWQQVLKGEWMLKFFAPWCPACRSMVDTWVEFGKWGDDLNLEGVGEIDVTQSPGLSGRFLITSLPTILHVKEGEFRQYSGKRDKDQLIDYVEGAKWKDDEVLPLWKHPNSIQMGVVASFFKVSMLLRNVHSVMTEQYDLPSWSVYVFFATVTILIGALLGLVLVFFIDCVLPYLMGSGIKQSDPVPHTNIPKKSDAQEDDDDNSDDGEPEASAEGEEDSDDIDEGEKPEPSNIRKRGKKAAKI